MKALMRLCKIYLERVENALKAGDVANAQMWAEAARLTFEQAEALPEPVNSPTTLYEYRPYWRPWYEYSTPMWTSSAPGLRSTSGSTIGTSLTYYNSAGNQQSYNGLESDGFPLGGS